jgi:hypothetical protein
MANDINVTPGAGKAVAAEDISNRFFQLIKIMVGGVGVALPLEFGQKAKDASLPVTLASDSDTLPVNQVSNGRSVKTTITRAANTNVYAAGAVVGGPLQFTAAGKAAPGGPALIMGAQLQFNIAAIPAGMDTFRLHLYSAAPVSNFADGAAFDLTDNDSALYLGAIEIPKPVKLGSKLYVEVNNLGKLVKLTSQNVHGYLQTVAGWAPGSGDVYVPSIQTAEI